MRALRGERDGFESLVRRHTRLGGAIAFGILGDRQAAEDVVQDAFFKAFRSLAELRDPGRFRAWFAEIVRRLALDYRRSREARSRPSFQEPSTLEARPAEGEGPAEAESRRETRAGVLAAIAALPPEDRTVVVLKHLEGLGYKEIAEVTGTTASAVESRLFRARRALREALEDPGR